ncbi:WD40-repeat-containing domain protein [Chytriomyces cf. hyalinus JEL632]|nr:WD40-repeat-containing domain protein [Chytriomyces cf. hyalinus JEL632]
MLMLEMESDDEGYSDKVSLQRLSETQRAEMAVQLLLTVSSATLSQVTARLLPLTMRDFVSALPGEIALRILCWMCVTRMGDGVSSLVRDSCASTTINSNNNSNNNPASLLAVCLRVSRRWNAIASDFTCWKTAFECAWPESVSSVRPAAHNKTRVDESCPEMVDWKYAYRQRLLLERNWINGDFSTHEISNAHNEAIYCLQFDEEKIISGSRDNTVQVFDTATLAHRHTLVGHSGSVLCLQFDDSILITGSSDSTIMVWNLPSTKPSSAATAATQPPSNTLSPTRILKSHKQSVLNIKFDSRWIVSCSKDKTIKVWSQTDGSLLRTLKGHKAAVNAVQFKGNVCVSASGDRTIKVWNLETGETLKTLVGHLRGIACIQFDGNVIVSGSSDRTIRIWNVHTGQLIRTLEGHTELVRTLQFDQTRIVSGSYDRSIKIWDMKSGAHLFSLDAHQNRVFKVQFNACRIVSCSQDQRIIVWDFSKGADVSCFS